jgi:hypothetical protein
MPYKSPFIVLLAIITIGIPVSAQDLPNVLDSFFTGAFDRQELNGNILVAEKGTILYKKSFGYANMEDRQLKTLSRK